MLPHTGEKESLGIMKRLRLRLAQIRHLSPDGGNFSVTASIGIAQWSPQIAGFEEIVQKADRALYQAKNSGRNRVCIASEENRNK